ncbi:MAG: cold shock domain-containing protein, partial [Nitrososphaeria archaeon]|nr:cold shock domain-containing protein [Nitrososphaeria archaeon]
TGRAEFLNEIGGFDFIVCDDGASDVYVNPADIRGERLSNGDEADFHVEQAERGWTARNVRKT